MRRFLSIPALLGLVLAGCGGGGSSGHATDADPASAVPARSAIYVEATVRPDGTLGAGAKAALAKVLGTGDPVGKLSRLADADTKKGELRFSQVVRWTGKRLGVFVLPSGLREDMKLGVVVHTTDAAAARRDLARESARQKERPASYRGVRYFKDEDGAGTAVVGDWVVLADPAEFRAAIDTIKGAPSLAGDHELDDTRAAVHADDAVAFASIAMAPLRSLALKSLSSATASDPAQAHTAAAGPDAAFARLFDRLGHHLGVALTGNAHGISMRTALVGAKLPKSTGAADPLAGLPAGGWLELALGRAGTKDGLSASLRGLPASTADQISDALGRIRQDTGVDVEGDLLSWMGDASLIVSGTSTDRLGGAISIGSTDGAKSIGAIEKIHRLLAAYDPHDTLRVRYTQIAGYDAALRFDETGIGRPLYIASNADRLVVGVDAGLLREVARPTTRLGDTAQYRRAQSLLGDGVTPTLILDVPAVLRLAEHSGDAASDPDYRRAKRYLDTLGVIAVGGEASGDARSVVAAVELR